MSSMLAPIRMEQDGQQKFTNVSQFPMGSFSNMRVWEHRLLYCVPVPGQNSWIESSSKVVLNQCTNRTFPQREKHQRKDDAAIDYLDMQVVEDDLIAVRQADRSLGSQDFSRWLTMGRLMSLSFVETSLSLEHWQMAKELQRLRRERLQ